MTPAARVQAAIDLVDAILNAARGQGASADTLARNFFRERRYMGSGDRRAVRDLAWRAVRRFEQKYGARPNICYVHPSAFGAERQRLKVHGVVVAARLSVLRHHFWVGCADPAPEHQP